MPERRSEPSPSPLFRPRATSLFRAVFLVIAVFLAGTAYSIYKYYRSPYWNEVGYADDQPVLFSHRHHAGELRIDCRFCHTTVETSAVAGVPATDTCLACHSQLFTDSPMLRPVVRSAATGRPLGWQRVTDLPDHVYFHHGIHVAKGVACLTCHGEVGRMALTAKAEPLTMRWCLDCHRDPGPRLAPRDRVFAATRSPAPPHPGTPPAELVRARQIHPEHLTNCSTCHR